MSMQKVVGNSHPGRTAADKAKGSGRYTDDLQLPGMVYGMILRSPYAHALVKSIDTRQAENVPGVLKILLPWEVPSKRYNCSGNPPSALLMKDELILTDHPLCLGDRIAAVAATSPRACREALQKLNVVFEKQEPVFDVMEALEEEAPLLHPEMGDTNLVKTIQAGEGDVEKGFEESDFLFEEVYETPPIQNVSMEPNGCICDASVPGKMMVISTSQTPFQERRILAELMDLKESDVRVIKPFMGGGFGERQQLHSQPVAALLSRETGRPVKIIHTREEQMVASVVRHSARIRMKVGVTKDGWIRGMKIEAWYNTGAYATHGPIVVAAGSRKVNYRIPHYEFRGHCVYTNGPVSGAVRGYGNPQLTFARETMMDTIARKLGMDPVAFRMKNHVKTGDHLPGVPYPLLSCAVDSCVEKGETLRRAIDEEDRKNSLWEGKSSQEKEAWGVAFCCHTSGPSSREGMSASIILINDDGSANLLIGSADIGQGSETILAQMAAEGLGIRLEEVSVTAADTGTTPYDTGTFASSQTYVSGNAVSLAVEDVRSKVMQGLAENMNLPEKAIAFQEGYFVVSQSGETLKLSLKEAVKRITFGAKGGIITGSSSYKAQEAPPPFAVCWAKVAVDQKTSSLRLMHIIEAVDVGNPINPEMVKAQVHGGVSMGIGYALMEEIQVDGQSQKVISSDLLHYQVPLAMDMPPVHVCLAESWEPSGPFGAKSVGELATVPVAAAIANAVAHATGETMVKIPLSGRFRPDVGLGRWQTSGKGRC